MHYFKFLVRLKAFFLDHYTSQPYSIMTQGIIIINYIQNSFGSKLISISLLKNYNMLKTRHTVKVSAAKTIS